MPSTDWLARRVRATTAVRARPGKRRISRFPKHVLARALVSACASSCVPRARLTLRPSGYACAAVAQRLCPHASQGQCHGNARCITLPRLGFYFVSHVMSNRHWALEGGCGGEWDTRGLWARAAARPGSRGRACMTCARSSVHGTTMPSCTGVARSAQSAWPNRGTAAATEWRTSQYHHRFRPENAHTVHAFCLGESNRGGRFYPQN